MSFPEQNQNGTSGPQLTITIPTTVSSQEHATPTLKPFDLVAANHMVDGIINTNKSIEELLSEAEAMGYKRPSRESVVWNLGKFGFTLSLDRIHDPVEKEAFEPLIAAWALYDLTARALSDTQGALHVLANAATASMPGNHYVDINGSGNGWYDDDVEVELLEELSLASTPSMTTDHDIDMDDSGNEVSDGDDEDELSDSANQVYDLDYIFQEYVLPHTPTSSVPANHPANINDSGNEVYHADEEDDLVEELSSDRESSDRETLDRESDRETLDRESDRETLDRESSDRETLDREFFESLLRRRAE